MTYDDLRKNISAILHNSISDDQFDLIKKLMPLLPSSASNDGLFDLIKKLMPLLPSSASNDGLFDLIKKLMPLLPSSASNDGLFDLIKKLIADVHSEYTSFTDDTIRQKLSVVLPIDLVDRFFGFIKDNIELSAKKEQVTPDTMLDPLKYNKLEGIRVTYDPMREWQYVIHKGVLTDEKKRIILSNGAQILGPGPSEAEKEAYGNFLELLDDIELQQKQFFDKYFEGLLTYEDLYDCSLSGLSERAKRQKAIGAILPFIQHKLIRQFLTQTLAANLNADPKLTEMLISDVSLLSSPLEPDRPLIDAFAPAGDNGVSVDFFDNNGNQIGSTITVETADTAIKKDNLAVKPSKAYSAHFDGYFEVSTAGAYRFFLLFSKKDTESRFRLFHLSNWLINEKATKDGQEVEQTCETETRQRT